MFQPETVTKIIKCTCCHHFWMEKADYKHLSLAAFSVTFKAKRECDGWVVSETGRITFKSDYSCFTLIFNECLADLLRGQWIKHCSHFHFAYGKSDYVKSFPEFSSQPTRFRVRYPNGMELLSSMSLPLHLFLCHTIQQKSWHLSE